MKWSYKIGRLLGVDLYVHATFLLLLGVVALAQGLKEGSVIGAMSGGMFFLALFICVLLHEYGHALAARTYGIQTKDITLLPIGGVARLERMPEKPLQELWVAIAGPMVNAVIAGALFAGLSLSGNWRPSLSMWTAEAGFIERLMAVNLFLIAFNLLPAFPMDGGRVLRSLLALRTDYARATRIAAGTGQAMAVLFGFAGLFMNPMLILIAVFVWIGASQEASAVEVRSSLAGIRVREAMVTDFRTLSPNETLGHAATLLLAGSQQDFPVVDNDRVVGMLTEAELLNSLKNRGEFWPVGTAMDPNVECVSAEHLLEPALASLQGRQLTIPVTLNGRIVGLLTAENIGQFVMVRSALGSRKGRPAPPILPPPLPFRQPTTKVAA